MCVCVRVSVRACIHPLAPADIFQTNWNTLCNRGVYVCVCVCQRACMYPPVCSSPHFPHHHKHKSRNELFVSRRTARPSAWVQPVGYGRRVLTRTSESGMECVPSPGRSNVMRYVLLTVSSASITPVKSPSWGFRSRAAGTGDRGLTQAHAHTHTHIHTRTHNIKNSRVSGEEPVLRLQ